MKPGVWNYVDNKYSDSDDLGLSKFHLNIYTVKRIFMVHIELYDFLVSTNPALIGS